MSTADDENTLLTQASSLADSLEAYSGLATNYEIRAAKMLREVVEHCAALVRERDEACANEREVRDTLLALDDLTRTKINAQKRALDAVRAIDVNCTCGSDLCDGTISRMLWQRQLDAAFTFADVVTESIAMEAK